MPDKHWPNTWTEVEDLGNGKFAASITVGHRVFFDKTDGNKPKKHKLTDNRPNYVLIQGAKCCVEIHPFYAVYYDVQHEEVRLEEERWAVQRLFKEPDKWRDVDAYNPQVAIEETSDAIKVTVVFDTDYGVLTVEYFQRDGNALKHNVFFKNTSGSTETFRVIQKWTGIVGSKCNGKDIPVVTDEYYLAFHDADKPARKFNISENLYSMVFNEDGSEKTEHCLQRPITIETSAGGLKVDFIYGNWVLAQNESLEIDPDTATLDDPTEDGHITYSPIYTRDNVENYFFFGASSTPFWSQNHRGYAEWAITSLAGATLTANPIFKYHGNGTAASDEEINPLTEEAPSGATDENLYGYIASGTAYVNPFNVEFGANKEVSLGASAETDLQTAIDAEQAWFAIGFQSPADEGQDFVSPSHILSEDKTGPAADPPPTLYVEYDVGGPTIYERSAAVAIGIISTALRNLVEAREASVDVGVAVSALRIKVIIRKAAVAIGIRVWEGYQEFTRNATVAVGMAISASRTVVYGRSASVAVGVAVSAGRNVARATFAASVAIGIAVSALRLKRVLRVASVLVGITVSASRALVILREAAVETGITIASFRKKRVLRKAAVDIGIIATAPLVAKSLNRLATVLVGVTVSASRNLALATKSATVEVGIAVSATSAKVKIYIASVAIGVAVSASRGLSLAREASVDIGIDASALRIKVIHKLAPVAIGIIVSALRLKRVLRVASVEVGITASASKALKLAREAVVEIGIAVSALRVKVIHIAASVLIGITASAQTTTIITKYFRYAAVVIGVAASASKSIIVNRYASTAIGVTVSALKIKTVQRFASVAVGIAVSASRSLILGRFASVAVGVTAWATRVWYVRHLVGTLITTQYRNVQMITTQYRLVQVITAMYRKVKLIIS